MEFVNLGLCHIKISWQCRRERPTLNLSYPVRRSSGEYVSHDCPAVPASANPESESVPIIG